MYCLLMGSFGGGGDTLICIVKSKTITLAVLAVLLFDCFLVLSQASDLKMLLQCYEHWAHRLFPKFPFDAVVEQVQRLGSKKLVQVKLWLSQYCSCILESRDFKICYGKALLRRQEVTFIPGIFTTHARVWVSSRSRIKTARRF